MFVVMIDGVVDFDMGVKYMLVVMIDGVLYSWGDNLMK